MISVEHVYDGETGWLIKRIRLFGLLVFQRHVHDNIRIFGGHEGIGGPVLQTLGSK